MSGVVRRIVGVLGLGFLFSVLGVLFSLWVLFGTSVAISRDAEHFWE